MSHPTDPTPLSRRAFATALGAALTFAGLSAGLACARPALGAARRALATRAHPLGLQLYTVRALMERDVDATLAEVAAIGYREVEFAGYFGRSAAEIRTLLARHDLRAPAAHIPFDRTGDGWPAALVEAAEAGHEYVIVPWLPDSARGDADAWRRTAERLNRAGEAAGAAGLRFGYHNHDFEFRPANGALPFDILLAETDPAHVTFELDLYWMVRAGHDPAAYFARHPNRFRLVHIKDSAGPPAHRMTDVGAGTIDFARLLPLAERAGVVHFFVEHDEPADPMASARASYGALRRLMP